MPTASMVKPSWHYERDSLKQYGREVKIGVNQVIRNTARDIRDAAVVNCPKQSGALAASGYVIAGRYNDYDRRVAVAISLNPKMIVMQPELPDAPNQAVVAFAAGYAGYVHDGTTRNAANPFLTRAIDLIEPIFFAAVSEVLSLNIPRDNGDKGQ